MFLSQVENELFEITKEPTRYSNLSQEERRTITTLADDRSIVIKKADKGSGIVVCDRADYLRKAEKQLLDKNVYQEVQSKKQMLSNLVDTSNKFFRGLKTKGFIAEKELKYFTYEYKKACNLGKMYLLPKIHKRLSDVPGRPVISNCGMPTEKVSEFLDYQLKPVMQNGKSYIRDSGHFLERIKNINTLPENAMIVTADVVGLYPSIPHEAGLSALKKVLENRSVKKIPTENLIKMAEFVLKNNIFEFNNKVFQQISGTAIGTKFAPPYARICMDRVEQELQPLLWLRFIDDIFFIWTHGKEELKKFIENFNNFTPNLRFTYEYSEKSISFLDLIITVSEQKLKTTLHIKSTDRHQYLHYASPHPEHTKRSVVFSQTLRISRLCSEENDFKNYRSQRKSWFLKREYPEKLTENEMRKVKFCKEEIKKAKVVKGIPFVVTYHPQLKNLGRIINKNIYLLNMNEETKKVFSPRPMVSFRSPRKISSYLVRAKLYPLDRVVGSMKCGKKSCEVCMNVSETNTFTSNVTGETYKINQLFSQTLRISRLYSEENDFKNYRSQMKSWFLKREYPEKLTENEMRKVKFCKEEIKKAKVVKGIP